MSQEQMKITGTEARKLFSKIHVAMVMLGECTDETKIKKEMVKVIQDYLKDPRIIVEDFEMNDIYSFDLFFREAE